MSNLGVWLTLANILISLILIPATLIWKLTRLEVEVRHNINASRNEVMGRIDTMYREFGETVAAIRQGVTIDVAALRKELTDAEKFNRDTFMRRDSFYKAQEEIKGAINAAVSGLDKRLERMESKIDSKK